MEPDEFFAQAAGKLHAVTYPDLTEQEQRLAAEQDGKELRVKNLVAFIAAWQRGYKEIADEQSH